MSKLGEWLAWKLNRLFPPLAIHQELRAAKSNIRANQRWAYKDAKRVCRKFGRHWNLSDQEVLNVGHGLGGKLPFYLEAGAQFLVGIDIDVQSTHIAQKHVHSLDLNAQAKIGVSLIVSDAGNLPFCDNSFDAVVSINTFEHIMKLEEALQDCHRVLRTGGLAFLYLPPYYSPWGPHLENWIHFPWPHLLFSDKTLMRVAAREDAQLQLNQQFVEAARVDWLGETRQIPGVNRVTLGQFRKMLSRVGFSIVEFKLLPFGHDTLNTGSFLKRLIFSLLNAMVYVPILQEIIVTKMVCVFRKEA